MRTNILEKHLLKDIAIIGGGFSGALTLANLVQQANRPLSIVWYEASTPETLGKGVAYNTPDIAHLLNVRTSRMGAFADDPEGFLIWLQSSQGQDAIQTLCPTWTVDGEAYAPRALYGLYLQDIITETLKLAEKKKIAVERVHANIHAIIPYTSDKERPCLALLMAKAEQHHVRIAALATGNVPPKRFAFERNLIRGYHRYLPSLWHPNAITYLSAIETLDAQSHLIIIGTGLTMVDAITSLYQRGFKGHITAISRHGWLPCEHNHHANTHGYAWTWQQQPTLAPRTARSLLQAIRVEISCAYNEGYDWRSVIDSIRPITHLLWQQLPILEQQRFMRHLFALWSIVRHRMPPHSASLLSRMTQEGQLTIIAGRILDVTATTRNLPVQVTYQERGAFNFSQQHADYIINCTGPHFDISLNPHPLWKQMIKDGVVKPDALRAGIATVSDHSAEGLAQHHLYPLGALRVGSLLESIAVPELREQAQHTAKQMLLRIHTLHDQERRHHLMMGAWI